MPEQHNPADAGGHPSGVSPALLNLLEGLDNIAHVVVAFFFIVLAASVIVYASLLRFAISLSYSSHPMRLSPLTRP